MVLKASMAFLYEKLDNKQLSLIEIPNALNFMHL